MRLKRKRRPKIFISYRRSDSEGHADLLYKELIRHFGKDRVFMDIDTIKPGQMFPEIIEGSVISCDALLALIGRQWLTVADGAARRLDNPNDFVRLEIATGLKHNIQVIPVLVQGATMPGPGELPDDLAGLASRHACELSRRNWDKDVQQLFRALENVSEIRDELSEIQEAEGRPGRWQLPIIIAAISAGSLAAWLALGTMLSFVWAACGVASLICGLRQPSSAMRYALWVSLPALFFIGGLAGLSFFIKGYLLTALLTRDVPLALAALTASYGGAYLGSLLSVRRPEDAA